MILHHYIWGDIDIDIVEEVAPHFLIAKHYGNLALFCRLTKHQNHYFRNSDKRFYAAGFDDEGKSMNPSDEYIPFVPDILYDDDGIGYLRSPRRTRRMPSPLRRAVAMLFSVLAAP